jgi:hypothetical protein
MLNPDPAIHGSLGVITSCIDCDTPANLAATLALIVILLAAAALRQRAATERA